MFPNFSRLEKQMWGNVVHDRKVGLAETDSSSRVRKKIEISFKNREIFMSSYNDCFPCIHTAFLSVSIRP